MKVISYLFSIDKPSARGGLENIAVNIILELETYQIIKFFLQLIEDEIHKVHIALNELKDDTDKQKVMKEVLEIRKLVTKIVLTYNNMFGE